MILINKTDFTLSLGEEATESTVLLTKPQDISKNFNLTQMQILAEQYLGAKFEKGVTKAEACNQLFNKFAETIGLDLEAIKVAQVAAEEKAKAEKLDAREKARAERAANPSARKVWSKTYLLTVGRKPESTEKKLEMLWGDHADVICDAITELVNAGTHEATREIIMEKAVALGLYEKRKSTQGVVPIFSWWRKSLADCGWIAPKIEEKLAPEAKAEVEAPKV